MRRADRLFEIIQLLRRRRVVKARDLAERLEVSERTIYRDVQALIASRVPIDGEAGVGYSLRPGYDLPPLMFRPEELEALVFGARIVKSWSDPAMASAAEAALARIESTLPPHLRHLLADATLWAPADARRPPLRFDLAALRAAIRARRKVRFRYRDEHGAETRRSCPADHPLVLRSGVAGRCVVRAARRPALLPPRPHARRRVPRRDLRPGARPRRRRPAAHRARR